MEERLSDRARERAAVTALLSALMLLAQSSVATGQPSLTMEQAVQQSLARAPEIGAARQSEAAAAQRVAQARSAYYPRASVDASYSAHWPKNELPISLPPGLGIPIGEIDDYHSVRVGGQLSLRALDLARGARIDAAESSLASEQAKSKETAAGLALQVRATFLAALFARDLRNIATESLRLALEEEHRAELRVQVGTGSQLTLAQARVRVASLRAQQRQAESELQRQRDLLASLLGQRKLPDLSGELEALAGPVAYLPLEGSPTLHKLSAARRAAEQSAAGVARTFWPTVSLQARGGYEYPHALKVDWGAFVQGGISLVWDLWDGGLRRGQEREARAQARSIEELGRATEQSLRRRLIDVDARARTAQADLTSARETLQQTEVYLRVARASLAAGTGTELDVHNAELGLDRARISVQQALLNKALARAESLSIYGLANEPAGGVR